MNIAITKTITLLTLIFICGLNACSSETYETVEIVEVNSSYSGPQSRLVIGKFANKSPYLNGIFSDGSDKLGNQAKEILKTNLIKTKRYELLERDNLDILAEEAKRSGITQQIAGASVIVTGAVTDFGRKTVGSKVFFGLFGRSKSQIAYSKVTINVIDVKTGKSLYAVQGAGEYKLKSSEILGSGSRAGYDATLNGKVLNLSIVDAINKLVAGEQAKEWDPKNK